VSPLLSTSLKSCYRSWHTSLTISFSLTVNREAQHRVAVHHHHLPSWTALSGPPTPLPQQLGAAPRSIEAHQPRQQAPLPLLHAPTVVDLPTSATTRRRRARWVLVYEDHPSMFSATPSFCAKIHLRRWAGAAYGKFTTQPSTTCTVSTATVAAMAGSRVYRPGRLGHALPGRRSGPRSDPACGNVNPMWRDPFSLMRCAKWLGGALLSDFNSY
jgi:hypothetical protein